jgi:RNA recognition motif-containing protein
MGFSVGNLSVAAAGEELQHLFADDGSLGKCSPSLVRDTGRKPGFAFIALANANDETKAITDLQGKDWMGRLIQGDKSEPRPTAAAGGGCW